MPQFVNREQELAELDALAAAPGAQLIMMYGRRRIGKKTLLTHWARQTGLPMFYWVAKRDPRDLLLANFGRAVYTWQYGDGADMDIRPRDWEQRRATTCAIIFCAFTIALLTPTSIC